MSNPHDLGRKDQILIWSFVLDSEKRFLQQVDEYVIQASDKQDLELIREIDEQAQTIGISFYDMFCGASSNKIKGKIFPRFKMRKS